MTPVAIIAANETYDDVKRLITKIVKGFATRYRLDYHETTSAANEAYAEAYVSYDVNRGAFTTWVQFKVTKGLEEELRKKQRRERIELLAEIDTPAQEPRPFVLPEFLESLGTDARTAARIALRIKTRSINDMRHWVKQHLRDAGWTRRRVKQAFQEVRRKL